MVFNTRENRIKKNYEVNSGRVVVEQAGYISKQKRIDNIIAAGQRLIMARSEMYDYPPGVEPDINAPMDPTRRKDFDLADASMLLNTIQPKKKNDDIVQDSTISNVKGEPSLQEAKGEAEKKGGGV